MSQAHTYVHVAPVNISSRNSTEMRIFLMYIDITKSATGNNLSSHYTIEY